MDDTLLRSFNSYQSNGRFFATELIVQIILPTVVALYCRFTGRKHDADFWRRAPRLASRILTSFILDILPHTGLNMQPFRFKVPFLPQKPFPDTCNAMMELVGPKRASESWPCQRDQMMDWYNHTIKTGILDVSSLLAIEKVQYLLWACVIIVVGHFTLPYVDMAFISLRSTRTQVHEEESVEKDRGWQARLDEQQRYDEAVRMFWGAEARLKAEARYEKSSRAKEDEKAGAWNGTC